jgi:hypothetical protein
MISTVPLEVLHFAFVLLSGGAGFKRSEVASAACAPVFLSRIQSVLA